MSAGTATASPLIKLHSAIKVLQLMGHIQYTTLQQNASQTIGDWLRRTGCKLSPQPKQLYSWATDPVERYKEYYGLQSGKTEVLNSCLFR